MADDLTPVLVIGGAAALYLLTRPKPNPKKPAAGKGPSTQSQVCAVLGAVGASAAGGTAAQGAAAGAICDKVAPYVVDGVKEGGELLAKGTTEAAKLVYKLPGVKFLAHGASSFVDGGRAVLDNPTGTLGQMFGFGGGGRRMTPEEAAASRASAGVGSCGGWRGDCPPAPGAQTAGPGRPPATKPVGFR